MLATAAFVLAVVTGVLLAIPFDIRAPARSVELLEIASPVARLLRALHAWAGNLLLLFALLHTIEHLALGSERHVRRGVWLRLMLLIPALLYLMISGFILKADAEGVLAHQIVAGLLARFPLLGPEAAASLVGSSSDLQLAYVHHVATSTVIVWVLVIDHARRLWPSASATLLTLGAALLLSLLFPPLLHDGVDAVVKGPWYFVGLQEVLHWLTRPGWLWLVFGLLLLWLAALPSLPRATARRSKAALLVLLLLYVLVSLWAGYFRGAGWDVAWPWASTKKISSRGPEAGFSVISLKGASASRAPQLLGHHEGCVVCHDGVEGLSAAHSPAALGCRSCHLGNAFTLDAEEAHAGMVRVPGNLDTAKLSCGGAKCHGPIVERVRGAMMATGVGMVAVNRFAFGEQRTPDGQTPLSALGRSQADLHLKALCVSCHLGTPKLKPGPIAETSRGGGCTACHLQYARDKARYAPERARAFTHPALTVAVSDDHCFGCHSRSGRISLSYRGWSETALSPQEAGCPQKKGMTALCGPLVAGKRSHRLLADGRVLQRQPADIHQRGKMACVDCHSARDTMGDGRRHQHQDQAVEIACADCHRTTAARSAKFSALDDESQKILRLRHPKRDFDKDTRRYLLATRSNKPLLNTTVEAGNKLFVQGKLDGRRRPPKAPKPVCGAAVSGHERLSCRACHTGWAPRCVSCHTQYLPDRKTRDRLSGEILEGGFLEYLGTPRTSPPTLGVRRARDGKKTTIVPFAPGMVMTLNPGPKTNTTGGKAPPSAERLITKETIFRRLYAPVAPHTTTHKGRSCKSCHLDSIALGYGQGKLKLLTPTSAPASTPASTSRPISGSWRFEPAFELAPQDGLPADAWIGLFGQPRQPAATRSDARPFTPAEQERILRVGACLGCHDFAKSQPLYGDFKKSLERITPRCVLPKRSK